jgi:hypothetical protein
MNSPFAHIALVEDAAFVLADHPGYVWNKSQTRIRCSGSTCALVMDVDEDSESRYADDIFAIHQAEMLLDPITGGEPGKRISAEGRQDTCRHCGKPVEVRSNQWTHALTSSGVCDSASTRFSPFSDMAAPMKAAV